MPVTFKPGDLVRFSYGRKNYVHLRSKPTFREGGVTEHTVGGDALCLVLQVLEVKLYGVWYMLLGDNGVGYAWSGWRLSRA